MGLFYHRPSHRAALGVTLAVLVFWASPALGVPRETLEEVALRHYGADFLETARAYHTPRLLVFLLRALLTLAAAWSLAWAASSARGRRALAAFPARRWAARLLLVVGLYLVMSLLRLPFSLFFFVHARQHGLRHDTLESYLGDWGRVVGLGVVLTAVVALGVLGLFARFRRAGWALAGALVAVLATTYAFLAPWLIDPLFNRIQPMESTPLASSVLELVHRAGLEVDEVWVADASRRTRAVNAYFTGVGSSRRIVLYDTLVEKLEENEILEVVAHEIGHWRRRHLATGLGLGLLAATLGLALGQQLLGGWSRAHGQDTGDPALVFVAYAVYLTLMFVSLPAVNAVSRSFETAADRDALVLTADPEAFISGKVRMGRENLSNVLPPGWVEKTLFTHPANVRRIAAAEGLR